MPPPLSWHVACTPPRVNRQVGPMVDNGPMSLAPDDDRPVDLSDDGLEVLPDQTRDDTDQGWGDWRESESDDSYLLEDRPPHW